MGWPKGRPQTPEHIAKRAAARVGKPSARKGRHAPVTCGHPDRKHWAKGMCGSCYQTEWQRLHPRPTTWAQDHPDRQKYLLRRHTLKSRYGITPERFEEMYHEQMGRCANTGCRVEAPLDGLHLDHDHATGKVRALLCPPCNQALGRAREDPAVLQGLIDYIAAHR